MLGPGLITGASDDDPSGIATYSQVGAQFGYGLAWTLVLSYPLMVAIQEISARIGRVTGFGIAGNLRRHYPRGAGRQRRAAARARQPDQSGGRSRGHGGGAKAADRRTRAGCTSVLFAVLSAGLQIFTRYARYVAVLKYLCLALFAYVICAFMVNVAWSDVAWAIVWPPFSSHAAYLMAVTAVLGTTISPYLFFWQAGQEVEDGKERAGARPLIRAPEQAQGEFARIRIDTYLGMAISNIVALFIVITTAATLHAHGVTDIQTSAQAAEALRTVAGPFTFALFAAGIIGTGLLTLPVLAGSAAYALGETLSWHVGLARLPLRRPRLLCDHRRRHGVGRGAQFLAASTRSRRCSGVRC